MIREFNEEPGSHSQRLFLLRKEKNPQTGSTISVGGTARETNRCANSFKGGRGRKGKKNKQGLINDESKVIKLATTGLDFTSWKNCLNRVFFLSFLLEERNVSLFVNACDLFFPFYVTSSKQGSKEPSKQATFRKFYFLTFAIVLSVSRTKLNGPRAVCLKCISTTSTLTVLRMQIHQLKRASGHEIDESFIEVFSYISIDITCLVSLTPQHDTL